MKMIKQSIRIYIAFYLAAFALVNCTLKQAPNGILSLRDEIFHKLFF